jgi:hypothetical protein
MAAFAEALPRVHRNIKVRFTVESNAARSGIGSHQVMYHSSMEESCTCTLLDDSAGLSPLFRFGLARSLGSPLRRIAERYEAGAMLQYQYDPDVYDRDWGEPFVSPGFRDRATRFYDTLIQ